MDASTKQTGYIRYDEIEKFDIYLESYSSFSSLYAEKDSPQAKDNRAKPLTTLKNLFS